MNTTTIETLRQKHIPYIPASELPFRLRAAAEAAIEWNPEVAECGESAFCARLGEEGYT